MSNLFLFAASEELLHLAKVDILIIVLYFLMVVGIGFYLKKYASTGEEFFMAGRKMTAWIAGLSFISANLSSLETMGWSAMAYQYGMLGAHAYLIGAIPAILFLAVVMMPFYYICKTHSVPGYLYLRYGEDSRVLAGVSFTVMTVLVCGVNMFAMAKMLNMLLGWNIHVSIWVSSLTVALYVALGGLLSAVLNEVLPVLPDLAGHAAGADSWVISRPAAGSGMIARINEFGAQLHPGRTCQLHQPLGKHGFGWRQSDGHALDGHGVRPGAGGVVRLLVHRFPPGSASDDRQESARRAKRHHYRRRVQDAGAAYCHHSRDVGAGIAVA